MFMVNLTDEEKSILQGEQGRVRQVCMQYLVEMCEIAGAERLVDLDGTGDMHTPGIALAHYPFTFEEVKQLADEGGTFKIPTFANKAPFPSQTPIHGWEHCHMCNRGGDRFDDPAYHDRAMQEEVYAVLRKMGLITTHSCANYLTMTYWPSMGQHCSWFESSQMPYCNATLGARTNFDGSFATCLLGKAPYYDMHVTENRYGTALVKTDRLIRTDMDFDVYGFAIGEACTVDVPVVTGTARPTTTQFEKFNSAVHTGGAVRMYHMPGITPEAPTVEFATGGRPFKYEVMIDGAMLKSTYESLNFYSDNAIDLVYLGCPHLNIVDLMILSRKLDGKKCKAPLWIMTAPWIYDAAKQQGYLEIFEKAGASLMSGTCLAAMGVVPEGVRGIAVDTAKQAQYVTGCYPEDDARLQVCYGDTDDCINAALTGKWQGTWK
jgi:predicted aconitase